MSGRAASAASVSSPGGAEFYDAEAAVYDETRGGADRARAAAAAVLELVPARGTVLDVAGGTGIVSAELAAAGFEVVVADLSLGMLSVAATRLPGRGIAAAAERLPVRDGGIDVVTTIWLLHLMPITVADQVIAEAARVLRPGGHLVTSVDKDLAHGRVRRTDADHAERVATVAARHGLAFTGTTSFSAETRWSSGPRGQVFAVSGFRKQLLPATGAPAAG